MFIIDTLANFHDIPTLAVINSLSTHDEERFTDTDKHLLTSLFLDYCQSENASQQRRGIRELSWVYIDSEVYHDRVVALLSSPTPRVISGTILFIARVPGIAARYWQRLLSIYCEPSSESALWDSDYQILDPIIGAYAILEFVRRGYEYRTLMPSKAVCPPPPEVSIDDWHRGVEMIYQAIHGQIAPADFSPLLESTDLYWRRIGILGLRILVSSISALVISDERCAKAIFESPQHQEDGPTPGLAIELVAHSAFDVMSHANNLVEDWLYDAVDRIAKRVPWNWTGKLERLAEELPTYLNQILFQLLERVESIESDSPWWYQHRFVSLVNRWENHRYRRDRKLIRYIASVIDSPNEGIRMMAIDLLPSEFFDDDGLLPKLMQCIAHDPVEEVRFYAIDKLCSRQSPLPPEAIPYLPEFLLSIDPRQREIAFSWVEKQPTIHGSPILRSALVRGTDDPNPKIQMIAIEALTNAGVEIPNLHERLEHLREADLSSRAERFLSQPASQ